MVPMGFARQLKKMGTYGFQENNDVEVQVLTVHFVSRHFQKHLLVHHFVSKHPLSVSQSQVEIR
jgi:hypothetical protein